MKRKAIAPKGPFLLSVSILRDRVKSFDRYPFSIPCVRSLKTLKLDPKVTFLVGDNGSGKSTLIEAIAVAAGFNAEGGTKNFSFSTRRSEGRVRGRRRVTRPEIVLDGRHWQDANDFYDAFFTAVGAPKWHGRSLDALNDSIGAGQINRMETPYTIVVRGYAGWLRERGSLWIAFARSSTTYEGKAAM